MSRTSKTSPKKQAEDDFDDLIGASEPEGLPSIDLADVYGGVSARWLAQMFGYDPNTVKKKLSKGGLEPVGSNRGSPTYSLMEAAAYLVKPKVDLVEFIKGLRPNDLPPMLNEAYWSAMLKRQKFEENARDLWRTSDVLEVLGDTALHIRTTVSLWEEEIDRKHSLSNEQRQQIRELADKLLQDIYDKLVEAPARKKTPSSVAEEGVVPEQGDIRETAE